MNQHKLDKWIGMSMGVMASFVAVALILTNDIITPIESIGLAVLGLIAYLLLNHIEPTKEE